LVVGFGVRELGWRIVGSDGGCFSINTMEPANEHAIFSRCLNPQKYPGDRGVQYARVSLAELKSKRLRFWASPGMKEDLTGDWTYWAEPRFQSGVEREREDTVLETLRANGGSVTGLALTVGDEGSHRGLFAHAPSATFLEVPASARRLHFAYGIREGAWEAKSDGGCFELLAETVQGEEQTLWSRCLGPKERGLHRGVLELAAQSGPRRLVFRTTSGPQDDATADWTYWAEVQVD
jgi:hypothetical protein